ncbi:uncharacterized protein Z518_03514 [Rhinocladiella mackenziei CBS 650.93]|uniref:Uncharacterized protein n=1 Tax=Rhinocladiella mackenziei CBS 650.93 TaxID=1442369 RepID=A0A0D2G2T3_9EURO|nr:uncharacterized protein Z518_03514 [Rhinocladiella mackenziei CBS 650.93]KIX08857.1 hypothetical protein Z518_03514 [Rhinocladiella mackenziei CBS 650.93]
MDPSKKAPFDFTGKVFAVTGAASGIGLAVTKHLYSQGASLTLADIQVEALADLEKSLKEQFPSARGQIHTQSLDVADSKAVESWIASAVSALGPFDGVANIAGIAPTKRFPNGIADVTDEEWDRMIRVNLTGLFHCLRAQLQPGRFKDGGSIVTAGSANSKLGLPQDGGYATAKHGVLGLTKSLAKELGHREIRVNCICPGPVDTPILRGALQMLGIPALPGPAIERVAAPEEVGDLVAFLLSDHSRYISGTGLSIDGGWAPY